MTHRRHHEDEDIPSTATTSSGGTMPPVSGCEGKEYGGCFTVESMTVDTNEDDEDDKSSSSSFSYFGCIASRDIPKHTLIHTETFVLHGQQIWTAMEMYETQQHQTHEDDDDYLRETCGLSDSQREQLWNLHDQRHCPDGSSNSNDDEEEQRLRRRLHGIIYSNGFCNPDIGREPCLFVGATSRFNHSCRPSVGMDFVFRNIRLFTTRFVKKGDELCLCYNDVVYAHSAAVRRTFLRHKFQFDCHCGACRPAPSPDKEEGEDGETKTAISDSRRRKMRRLAQYLSIHVPGAGFLYDEGFERNIRQIRAERDEDTSNEQGEKPDRHRENIRTTAIGLQQHQWNRLMKYMKLLELESIDHEMLQCYELAYDLAISFKDNEETTTAATSGDTDAGENEFPTSIKTTPSRDPAEWARKTLALYMVHKGPNHTATQTFRLKVQSLGIV